VDHRRRNRSADSLRVNVQRLKEYLQRLAVHPRRGARKAVKGEATAEQVARAVQVTGPIAPIARAVARVRARKIAPEEREGSVYALLRQVRCNTRMAGIRKRRAEIKAAEEAEKKK
jgi:large subunit ribosomal protein L13e